MQVELGNKERTVYSIRINTMSRKINRQTDVLQSEMVVLHYSPPVSGRVTDPVCLVELFLHDLLMCPGVSPPLRGTR